MSADVLIGTASLSSGVLVNGPVEPALREQLYEVAVTVPEIFGTLELGCLSRIAQRLNIETDGDELVELLLLSDERVQVIRPLTESPELALVAVSREVGKMGLVLSQVHAHAAVGRAVK
jgi:hypothetical protein